MLVDPGQKVRLTFRLKETGRLAVASFLTVAQDTIKAVRELEGAYYTDGVPSVWYITAITMSDVLRVELEPSRITGLEAAGEYAEGLRLIKTHNKVPPRFTYRVFQHARKTLAVLDDGVASWLLATPSKRVKTTPDLARRVDALAEAGYHEWTSLDGVLSAIKWDETRPRFVITDELTGRRIECRFKPEDLPRVKEALPFRVEVAGRTRFNWLGEPVAIDVAEWDKIEADTDLPLVEDMEDLNITNGLDAAEFVRRLRHGD